MKIAEEQKKQFIVLCCLVVFVFAFGMYKIVGSGSHAQTRQTQAATKQTGDKNTTSDKPSDAQDTSATVVALDATGDQTARDPFIPQIDLDKSRMAVASTPTKSSFSPMVSTGKLSGLGPLIPPMPFDRKLTVTTNGGTTTAPAAEEQTDPSKVYKLTGVIQGSVNVAILRGPDDARYIVREGQLIDGKYRVDQVSRFGVRLSFSNRSYLLSLGGSDAVKGAQ